MPSVVSRLLSHSRPWLSTAIGSGIGGVTGYMAAPEEAKVRGALLGAGAGAAGGALTSRTARQELVRALRAQKYGITGKIPTKYQMPKRYLSAMPEGLSNTERYLYYLKKGPKGLKAPQPGRIAKAKQRIGEYARDRLGMAPKKVIIQPQSPFEKAVAAREAGMSSLAGMAHRFRTDPRGAAKDWWKHGGKKEVAMMPLWASIEAPSIAKAEPGKDRAGHIGSAIGGTLGWGALGMLPATVSIPSSILAGGIGKRIGRLLGKDRRLTKQLSPVNAERLSRLKRAR